LRWRWRWCGYAPVIVLDDEGRWECLIWAIGFVVVVVEVGSRGRKERSEKRGFDEIRRLSSRKIRPFYASPNCLHNWFRALLIIIFSYSKRITNWFAIIFILFSQSQMKTMRQVSKITESDTDISYYPSYPRVNSCPIAPPIKPNRPRLGSKRVPLPRLNPIADVSHAAAATLSSSAETRRLTIPSLALT
jgi:hypothetical protein